MHRCQPLVLVVLSVAFLLRFVNLGYSDYQGDGTKALYNPKDQTAVQFLLSQRKGPGQFLVTAAVKIFSHDYRNPFVTRAPFALAGSVSCIFFYLFVRRISNASIAFFALLFLATNGIFIAFSRIVQYQSLVLLSSISCLYAFQLYADTSRRRYLYLALTFWCAGLLTHSDAIFIAPMMTVQIYLRTRKTAEKVLNIVKEMLPGLIILLSVLLSVYIPLVLNSSGSTQSYWAGRLTGSTAVGIISSKYLFSLYQPIYGLVIYAALGLAGILSAAIVGAIKVLVPDHKAVIDKIRILPFLGVGLWLLCSLGFMEVLTKFPGTHIWVYILPLTILMGLPLYLLDTWVKRKPRIIGAVFRLLVMSLFIFLTFQSYLIFADSNSGYPWSKHTFLLWEVPTPSTQYQLSLFGFPYNRQWREISDFIILHGQAAYYSVNEKESIARYYLPLLEKNSNKAGYFIHIVKPQSFNNVTANKRGAFWMKRNDPIKTFYNNGNVVARVYLVPQTWGSWLIGN